MAAMLSDPGRLLSAWERGAGAPPVARGAAVIAAAGLVPGQGSALDLPLGECAALAIRAHVDLFGPLADCAATCPGCGELIELTLDLAELPTAPEPASVSAGSVTVRALTIRDLIDAGAAEDPHAVLVGRCVALNGELGPVVEAAVEEAAERLAGAAGVVVATACPGCGTELCVGLDPGLLLWEQVVTAAERLLIDVAALAGAYGWTEHEVLQLSPMRRAAYLELARR